MQDAGKDESVQQCMNTVPTGQISFLVAIMRSSISNTQPIIGTNVTLFGLIIERRALLLPGFHSPKNQEG
jgi:hypothetical protein